jgi:hypothetical protein
MEGCEVLSAIRHAVLAVERRSDGLQSVADRHVAASRRALEKMLAGALAGAPRNA